MLGRPGISKAQQALVDLGNALALFTVRCCTALYYNSCYFVVENPLGSWLWMLPPVVELASRAGVIFTEIAYSSFGVPWTKPTGLLHNTPSLHELSRKLWQDLPGPRVVLRG